jgi:hypothetical protein
LVKCALTETQYTVFGYQGKQVSDNIHSLDLVNMYGFQWIELHLKTTRATASNMGPLIRGGTILKR